MAKKTIKQTDDNKVTLAFTHRKNYHIFGGVGPVSWVWGKPQLLRNGKWVNADKIVHDDPTRLAIRQTLTEEQFHDLRWVKGCIAVSRDSLPAEVLNG